MKKYVFLFLILQLSGCVLFQRPSVYVPPAMNANTAKIRLAGYASTYIIEQRNDKGVFTGGTVGRNYGALSPLIKVRKKIGMPQVDGKIYNDNNYYETTLLPGKKTLITHRTTGCQAFFTFTPKEKGLYEFHYSYTDKSGYCVLYGKEIVYDEINKLYIEREIEQQ